MTKCIRIDPDGTITRCQGEAFDEAHNHFTGLCEVVTLAQEIEGRHIKFDEILVGWIDDLGRYKPLPLNKKAWALYGRSPIVGTMFVADDYGSDLRDLLIERLRAPFEDLTTEGLRLAMVQMAGEEGLQWDEV
jgi:hypothetical protein